jgi:PAS domain S-box-containing protein
MDATYLTSQSTSARSLNRVVSLLSLILVIYAFVFSWQSWREEKADRIYNLQNIMELGEKAIDTYFTQLENCIHVLSHDIVGTDDRIDMDHAFNRVKQFKESHPELFNITFIRGDGQILFTATAPPGQTLPTLAQEPSFLKFHSKHRSCPPLDIGQPLVSLISKEWIIPLRYVINDKEGKMAYVISANLPVGILQNFWKEAPFTKTAALGLIRDDGFLVSRYPVPDQVEMEKIYGIPRTGTLISYLKQHNFPINGNVQGPSVLDGSDHFHAFHRLEHFPITMFMVMPMSEIRAGWWSKVKVPVFLSAFLAIGGFFLYRKIYQQERDREMERWQASESLQKSEERFRILAENSLQAILILKGFPPTMVYVNSRWSEISGYTVEETLSLEPEKLQDMVHPEDGAVVWQRYHDRLMGKPAIPNYEFRFIRKDGAILWAEGFASKILANGEPFIMATIVDITERKQAEESLHQERFRLQSIIEGTQAGTWEWNVQTGETVLNEMWAQMLGYTLDELTPTSIRTWEALTHPDDLKQAYKILDRHIAGEIPYYNCECRIKHKSGNWIWVQDRGRIRTRTADGEPLMMYGTHMDISDRKQAEAQSRLSLKNDSLSRMAGAIAHHFNNQLYVVIGNLEIVMNDLPLESDNTERLIDAMKASHKAADVSRLMLTYLGQTPCKPELQDLSETCHKGMLMIQAFIPKKVSVEPIFPFPGPAIQANVSQIQLVLTNLVTNAYESISDKTGTITISVKTVPAADIPASSRFPVDWQPQNNLYACLEVADTGCGISEQEIENIFDPFFSMKFVGRGLGLSVVLGIVSVYGGGITVESEANKGSIFRVYLPAAADAIPVPLDTACKLPEVEERRTMLLIDDDEMVRNMANRMLTRIGFSVLEAADGVEAVEIFQQHQDEIRWVLSDLMMPRMNGWDTLTALRKISPEIPVILSSGYDEAQVMAQECSDRPSAFLGKPYQLKELREIVCRVLGN